MTVEGLSRPDWLRPLTDARAVEVTKRAYDGRRIRRDPQILVDMVLGTLE